MIKYPTLLKRTKTGAIQIWYQELDGNKFRSVSGQQGGKKVTSEWTVCTPKNLGRSNETTAEEQAALEVDANYNDKHKKGYVGLLDDVDNKCSFFEPMLAYAYKDKFDPNSGPWYSQPKLDGVRCLATPGRLQSRTGKDDIVSCPHILEAMKPLFEKYPNVVWDGELYNHELHDDFNKIISLVKKKKPTFIDIAEAEEKVQYHIYDCYDFDRPNLTFSERNNLIIKAFSETEYSSIIYVPTSYGNNVENLDLYFSTYVENGYEGQIIRTNSVYENKRTRSLLKRKDFFDEEFKIVDIQEGVGNRAGKAGRVVCQLDKRDETFGAGIKGSHEFAAQLLKDRKKYIGGDVTIRFPQRTPDGIPRFPVAVAFYPGGRDI